MKILFKCKFGSHLYGTNTPTSDQDFKGVFIESLDNIILRKDSETVHHNTRADQTDGVRNAPTDVDIEHKELRRFVNDCLSGQTYALDMLFAPIDTWLEFTPIWTALVLNRKKFLSKNVEPYIAYCRHQAGKYGLKGSRLGELLRVIEYLKAYDPKTPLYTAVLGLPVSEYVKMVEITSERPNGEQPLTETFLEVLTKKFSITRHIEDVLVSLERMNEKYGARARLAQENAGVDWKAISHAYRCMHELRELAQTGEIKFPLESADFLKRVKMGEISYDLVQEELPKLMESAIEMVKNSEHLPDEPDYEFWENFILQVYKNNL